MGGFKQNQGILSNALSLPQQQGLTIQAACYTDAAVMAHLMLADKQLSLARRSHPQIREIRPPGENGCSAWWALWRPIPAELPPLLRPSGPPHTSNREGKAASQLYEGQCGCSASGPPHSFTFLNTCFFREGLHFSITPCLTSF